MGEPEKSDYYISRKGRLMRDFDQVVKRVAPVFATRYGRAEAAALATDARHEFETILPELPYIGGMQPHTQFVVSGGWFLAMTRALGRHGRPVVEAGELVFQVSEHYLRVVPGFARHFLGSVSFSPRYLRKLRQRAAESQKRQFPGGYVFTYVEGDGTRFDYGGRLHRVRHQQVPVCARGSRVGSVPVRGRHPVQRCAWLGAPANHDGRGGKPRMRLPLQARGQDCRGVLGSEEGRRFLAPAGKTEAHDESRQIDVGVISPSSAVHIPDPS